jgi:hypothetical protein
MMPVLRHKQKGCCFVPLLEQTSPVLKPRLRVEASVNTCYGTLPHKNWSAPALIKFHLCFNPFTSFRLSATQKSIPTMNSFETRAILTKPLCCTPDIDSSAYKVHKGIVIEDAFRDTLSNACCCWLVFRALVYWLAASRQCHYLGNSPYGSLGGVCRVGRKYLTSPGRSWWSTIDALRVQTSKHPSCENDWLAVKSSQMGSRIVRNNWAFPHIFSARSSEDGWKTDSKHLAKDEIERNFAGVAYNSLLIVILSLVIGRLTSLYSRSVPRFAHVRQR